MNPLSQVYQWGVQFDRFLTRSKRLPKPVISVGNLTMGGRGKTPLCIRLAQEMLRRGATPVVLTRGYGRTRSQPVWLDPNTQGFDLTAEDCGDEALEIYLKANCFVLVGSDRYQNAKLFLKRFSKLQHVVFILDDGFQHWSLERDLDICLVESYDSEASVFPVGNLREHPEALKRADLVLEQGKDIFKKSRFLAEVKHLQNALALTTRASHTAYSQFIAENTENTRMISLPDHAPARDIGAKIREFKADELILGFKEAVKILEWKELKTILKEGVLELEFEKRHLKIFVVDCEVVFKDEEAFWLKIFECIF